MRASHTLRNAAQRPGNFMPVTNGLLQRKCACGGTPGRSGECEECRKKRASGKLLRPSAQPSTLDPQPAEVPPLVHEVLRSPGRPLDMVTRAFMEPRLGHDFSQVQVHADARSAESARAVDALAYTVGQHIVFAAGQHAPSTQSGRRLLTHELVHVVQQSTGGRTGVETGLAVGNQAAEREADQLIPVIEQAAPARPVHLLQSPTIQRSVVMNPDPLDKYGVRRPPKPRSPVPSCSALAHEDVMFEVARRYVRDEIDPSKANQVNYFDCIAGIGSCTFEFGSGVAVHAGLWLPYPRTGKGEITVEEIAPRSATDLTHPYFRRKHTGPKCDYEVDCPQPLNPLNVKVTPLGCSELGPGDYPTTPGDEGMA